MNSDILLVAKMYGGVEVHLLCYNLELLNFSPPSLNLIWLDCGRWHEHGTYLEKKDPNEKKFKIVSCSH